MLTINVISTINVMKTQTINVINYKIINHKCTNILTINVVSIENRMNSSTFRYLWKQVMFQKLLKLLHEQFCRWLTIILSRCQPFCKSEEV